MKPRIKRDVWSPIGFICRSREPGGFFGTHLVAAYGDTMEQAYTQWEEVKKRKSAAENLVP